MTTRAARRSCFSVKSEYLRLAGQGKSMETLQADLAATLIKSGFNDQYVDSLAVEADYHDKNLAGTLYADSREATIELTAILKDVSGKREFNIISDVRQLNLAAFGLSDNLQTEINASVQMSGKGLWPELEGGEIRLQLASSYIMGLSVDTSYCVLNIYREQLHVETFVVHSPLIKKRSFATISLETTYRTSSHSR